MAQGWPTPHFGLLGLFPCVAKEAKKLPSDVENCVVCLRQITQSVILLAMGRKIVDFVALAISRSMILHARASKIIFCLLFLAVSQIMILHARASTIIDFVCSGELPNPSFCMTEVVKSLILIAWTNS